MIGTEDSKLSRLPFLWSILGTDSSRKTTGKIALQEQHIRDAAVTMGTIEKVYVLSHSFAYCKMLSSLHTGKDDPGQSFYSFNLREIDHESMESVMWGGEGRRESFAALIAERGQASDDVGVNVMKTNAEAD